MVVSVELHTQNLPWDDLPLAGLTSPQQLQFKAAVQLSHHRLGEVLWSTQQPGVQLLVLRGKVRLVQQTGKSALTSGQKVLLKPGDWFGDLLELAGHWRAIAASQDVLVAFWPSLDWYESASPELRDFWEDMLDYNSSLSMGLQSPENIKDDQ